MSDSHNPYATPQAVLESQPAHDYWREDKVLVMRIDSALPDRCVKCNEPAVQPIKPRWVHWHHPAVYLVILLNILLYVIVALIVRKKAKVGLGLCPKHRSRRHIFLAIGWGGFAFGLGAMIAGSSSNEGGLIGVGVLIIFVAAIVGIIGSRAAYPSRITKEEVRLKGCGPAFLDSLESR